MPQHQSKAWCWVKIFTRLLCRAKRGMGWETARPCVSKEAKPAKIVSLIVPPRGGIARAH